jgi:hypothetical protein
MAVGRNVAAIHEFAADRDRGRQRHIMLAQPPTQKPHLQE